MNREEGKQAATAVVGPALSLPKGYDLCAAIRTQNPMGNRP
jgi:hypothetical protein